jgi:hypothetical protein
VNTSSLHALIHPDAGNQAARPIGFTPAQLIKAYGLDQIKVRGVVQDGTGQTIAIVDSGDNPNFVDRGSMPLAQDKAFLASDLHHFDVQFHLPEPPGFFVKVNQDGNPSPLPDQDPGFEAEIALDVEWAHALAPGAKIILVESKDEDPSNLISAASVWAGLHSGASVVSMSFSGDESAADVTSGLFVSPADHGVTYLSSTGDFGSTGQNSVNSDAGDPGGWPAFSPNVVAVGGTSLFLNANSTYKSETGWSRGGGGISLFEPKPAYQDQVNTTNNFREAPDISFLADPATGIPIYDTFNNDFDTPWNETGGTSFSCPAIGALIAIADQIRAEHGLGSLDGASQVLPTLYGLPSSDIHDITTGFNGNNNNPHYSAGPGYDLVTGLGTPIANRLVPDVAGAADVSFVSTSFPNGIYKAGTVIPIKVTFTGVVTVSGTPSLALNSGGTATYVSGSGTNVLTFRYVVGPGENVGRLDFASTTALSNDGSITYGAGLPLDLNLPAPGAVGSLAAASAIAIDTTPPTLVDLRVLFGSRSYSLLGSTRFDLPWRITGIQAVFSQPVFGVPGSLAGLPVTGFSGSGTTTLTWSVTPLTLGVFNVGLVASSVTDRAGNRMSAVPAIPPLRVLYGDVLGHGVVDLADMQAISQAAQQSYNLFADVNGDGVVNARDLAVARAWLGRRLPRGR